MAFVYGNNSVGTLAQSIGVEATQFVMNPGQYIKFPVLASGQSMYVTFTDVATQSIFEIMQVTANDLSVFDVIRGQDGTTALSWTAGAIISLRAIRLQYEDYLSKTFGGAVAADLTINALLTALNLVVTNGVTIGTTLDVGETISAGSVITAPSFNVVTT